MAITATERTEIEKLLVLMFNAAPGAAYLAEVVTLFENVGHNLQKVANSLDDLDAFKTLHPNFQTAAEFAVDFLTPLGLQNDTFAKNFIIDKFNAGVPKGEIAYEAQQALNGVTDTMPAQYVTARDILANKAAVAEYYSVAKGITNLDLGILQTVLNGVTDNDATVITAEHEIDSGTRGVQGITAALTTSQDTVIGTNAADLINGLFGGGTTAPTYTSGDSIDGGAGTDRLNLVATGTDTSPAVTVKNVESINIQDTVGAKFDALLVENNAGISFTNTIAGKTSTVINGALGSVMGLAGKGDLLVDYITTSGTSDTANVALSGVGTSATVMSTINVNDTNTVEAMKIATTGTNFVNLLAGTAAGTVTITGDGTNTFTVGSIKAVSTIDASASTGTNVFNLGGSLSNGDVVKGGTGADTVNFGATSAIGGITLTGVETLKGDIDADVAINLGTSTGLKTLTLAGGTGSVDVTNATSELATVNYQSVGGTYSGASGDFDNDFSLTYKTGQVGHITLNLGSATATQQLSVSDFSFTRAESLVVNALGTKAIDVAGGIDFDDSTKSITLNAGDSTNLWINGLSGGSTGSNILATLTATVGADASLSGGSVSAGGSENLAVTLTVGASGSGDFDYVSAGSFGDITVSVGAHASGSVQYAHADNGGFGNLSLTVGSGGSGYLSAYAHSGADGSIGDATLTLASGAGGQMSGYAYSGDIGNLTVNVGANGDGTMDFYAYGGHTGTGADQVYSAGGNLGDITVNVTGAGGVADVSAYADAYYSGAAGAGGNVGNVVLNVTGSGASGYVTVQSSGGSQGDYTVTVGASAYGYVSASAGEHFETAGTGDNGNIGNINVGLADGAYFSGYFDASGSVGNLSIEGGNDVRAQVSSWGYSGDVGTTTVSLGDNAYFSGWYSASAGSVGDANVTVGEGATISIGLETQGGSLGAINVTAGVGSNVAVYSDGYAPGHTTAGAMTVAGGEAGDMAYGYASGGSIEGIDFHGWLGTYTIDARSVGRVDSAILGGAGGGAIYGTAGGDIITGGAGADYIDAGNGANVVDGGAGNDFLVGGTASDVLNGGAGNDTIIGGAGTDAIDGGAGNDVIDGGTGNDQMTGGAGNDTFYVDSLTDVVNENAGEGTDTVISSIAGYVLPANVEILIGSGTGNAGANTMTGTSGADTLNGGAGNDTISGLGGVDSLTGGADADTFVFTGANLETITINSSTTASDVITDFVSGTDKLDFTTLASVSNYVEVTTPAADLPTLMAAADSVLDGTIDYYFGVVGTDGYLFHSDAGTTVDAIIKLTGVTHVAATDIV